MRTVVPWAAGRLKEEGREGCIPGLLTGAPPPGRMAGPEGREVGAEGWYAGAEGRGAEGWYAGAEGWYAGAEGWYAGAEGRDGGGAAFDLTAIPMTPAIINTTEPTLNAL